MTATASKPDVLNLVDQRMFFDPFPTFAALRRDEPVAPVKVKPLVRGTGYLLTRHEDVLRVHTDKRFSSDPLTSGSAAAKLTRYLPKFFRLLTDGMVFKDDPEHKRLRGLVNKAFTPKTVQRMEADIERMVDRLVDQLARHDGPVDLVESFAVALPLAVISEMLGVTEQERDGFHVAMKRFLASSTSPMGMVRNLPTGQRMVKMFERMAADRRLRPDEGLITAMVQAREDGDGLTDTEIVSMVFLLLLAGHDTTSNLIGTGVLSLLDDPASLERLRAEPEVADRATEELVRFTAPVLHGAPRILTEPVEVHGRVLPKGAQVIGMIASANRDEEVFERPDELDFDRDNKRHLGFAFGSHFCLGNQLARMEGRIAFRALTQRFEQIELAVPRDRVEFKMTPSLRGVRELPLRLG